MKYWNIEILKYWNIEILKFWNLNIYRYIEIFIYSIIYILKYIEIYINLDWNIYSHKEIFIGILKYWKNGNIVIDIFTFWFIEISKYRKIEILKYWNIERLYGSQRISVLWGKLSDLKRSLLWKVFPSSLYEIFASSLVSIWDFASHLDKRSNSSNISHGAFRYQNNNINNIGNNN